MWKLESIPRGRDGQISEVVHVWGRKFGITARSYLEQTLIGCRISQYLGLKTRIEEWPEISQLFHLRIWKSHTCTYKLYPLNSRVHHYYAKALFLTFHAKGHLGLIKFNHLIVDAEQYYYYAWIWNVGQLCSTIGENKTSLESPSLSTYDILAPD